MSLTRNEPTRKSGRPPHVPAEPPHAFVTLRVPTDGAVHRFFQLVAAVDARDYRGATDIRRGLYRLFGWSILPPKTASWPGRRS
jgi:hypothetical protein